MNGGEAADPPAAERDAAGLLPVSGPGCPDVALRGVSKTFGEDTHAVIDFSADFEHGEFVAMLGPSGCGKTTTLRMIGGLEEATEGRIYIAGEDVTDLPPSRRDTAMMFQSFALFPHRTVFQNVEFSLKMKGMDPEERARRVWRMLEMVSLAELAARRPSDLSGGQQQRVALARALIGEPTVLLLDEPLGALDYNLRQQMMLELKKIQRETGITFVMVTHSQQEAMSMADKVIVMSDAVVQQIGSSREIYEHPRTKFVAEFIGNNNLLPGTVRSHSGSVVFVESFGHVFYVRAPDGEDAGAGAGAGSDGGGGQAAAPVGREAWFSVRADLMSTGERADLANRIEGVYVTTEFLGSLETDVFEVAPGHYLHVEQHRSASDRAYEPGERETISWAANAGVLLLR